MKIIHQFQQWDFHHKHNYYYIENDKVICSFTIQYCEKNLYHEMKSLYVDKDQRGRGLFHKMMQHIIELTKDVPVLYITVKKDLFIFDKYKEYGFVYHKEYDDKFDWMIKRKTGEQ